MGFINSQIKEEKFEETQKEVTNKEFVGVNIEPSDKELMLNMIAKDFQKGLIKILKKYQEANIKDMSEAFNRAYNNINSQAIDEALNNES